VGALWGCQSVRPLPRQAAGTLCVSPESVVEKVSRAEKAVQSEKVVCK